MIMGQIQTQRRSVVITAGLLPLLLQLLLLLQLFLLQAIAVSATVVPQSRFFLTNKIDHNKRPANLITLQLSRGGGTGTETLSSAAATATATV